MWDLQSVLGRPVRTARSQTRCGRTQARVVAQAAATEQKTKVPTELEEGELPLNTFSPKKPFVAKIRSVEKITGPKATGETCHIIIDTDGDIPFWEGQSYGVIPPVSLQRCPVHLVFPGSPRRAEVVTALCRRVRKQTPEVRRCPTALDFIPSLLPGMVTRSMARPPRCASEEQPSGTQRRTRRTRRRRGSAPTSCAMLSQGTKSK